jgi:hypothetical protein
LVEIAESSGEIIVKKFIVTVAIISSLVIPRPQPAHAAVGLITIGTPAGVPLLIGGGAAVGAAALMIGLGAILDDDDAKWTLTILGFFIGVAGLIVLDQNDNSYLKFSPVTASEGHEIGLTAQEITDFNLYNDELNAVSQAIGNDLRALKKPTLQDSQALWEKYRGLVPSDAAYTAAGKVSARWIKPLAQGNRS